MSEKKDQVPNGLRTWFVIHFVADVLFAIPLLVFPQALLNLFGWGTYDPIMSRLVGAALMGIGSHCLAGMRMRTPSARCSISRSSGLRVHYLPSEWELLKERLPSPGL